MPAMPRRFSLRFVLPVLLAVTCASVFADPLSEAKARFDEREFAQAAQLFEKASESLPPSPSLFYDLGRSYMELGNTARAALNFRRALLLDPRFTPAASALRKADTQLALPAPNPGWRDQVLQRVPMDSLALGATILFWTAALMVLLGICRAQNRNLLPFGAALLLLAFGGLALVMLCDPRISGRTTAIVLTTGGTTVRSTPADNSEKIASLPEGSLVRILSQRGRWYYGLTGKSSKGWFLTEGIVPLIPPQ